MTVICLSMIEVSTREFTRHFPKYRAKAARGEAVRVSSRGGDAFLFTKEPGSVTAAELLKRLEGGSSPGIFDEDGAQVVAEARAAAKPARDPWA